MIALDANTALRSFRDGTYDLVEIAVGLDALISGAAAIHLFKYADGKVQPMLSAAMCHNMTTSFPSLVVGEGVSIRLKDDGLSLGCATSQYEMLRLLAYDVLPYTLPAVAESIKATLKQMDGAVGLQAKIVGDTEYIGEGPLPVEQCHIGELAVSGLLEAEDAGAALEGKTLTGLTAVSVDTRQGAAHFDTLSVEGEVSLPDSLAEAPISIGRLAAGSMTSIDDPGASVNYLQASSTGSQSDPQWFGYTGATGSILSTITLTNKYIRVEYPAASPEHDSIEYCYNVPYVENGETRYLPGRGVRVPLSDKARTLGAPGSMPEFLLWPSWATYMVEGEVPSVFWQACIPEGELPPFFVVTVRNGSDSPIDGVANVWTFNKYMSQGREYGSVNVLHRVTLPPRSSVEFLFSYNRQANTAYMSPMRAL